MQGAYIYGDFATGLIFAVRQKNGKATEHGTIHQQKGTVYQIASFGEDAEGEVYLLPLVATPQTVATRLEASCRSWLNNLGQALGQAKKGCPWPSGKSAFLRFSD